MGEIAKLFATIGADTSDLDRKLKKSKSKLEKVGKVAAKIGKVAAAGLAATAVAGVKMAMDFESSLAILGTAVDGADADMGQLSDAALKMGADTSLVGISASDAVEAMTVLSKAGLSTAEIFGGAGGLNDFLADNAELSGAARAAADLQAASELGLAQSAELVAVAMKTFNLTSEDAVAIGDSFVKAADASVASVSDLAMAMENVGPTAASFGFSLDDTNTALAILSTRGIAGAEAGTALKSMFTNIMRPTKDVKKTLTALGVSLFDMQGNMRALPTIVSDLETSMAGLTQEQRLSTIQTLAGTFGMKAMATLLGEGAAGWDDMTQAMKDAAGAQEIAEARTNTFAGKMEALGGVVETLLIHVGNELLPVLSDLAIWASDFIEKNAGDLVQFFKTVVSVVKVAADVLMTFVGVLGEVADVISGQAARDRDFLIAQFKAMEGGGKQAAIAFQKLAASGQLTEEQLRKVRREVPGLNAAIFEFDKVMARAAETTKAQMVVAMADAAEMSAQYEKQIANTAQAAATADAAMLQRVGLTLEVAEAAIEGRDALVELSASEVLLAEHTANAKEQAAGLRDVINEQADAARIATEGQIALAESFKNAQQIDAVAEAITRLSIGTKAEQQAANALRLEYGFVTEASNAMAAGLIALDELRLSGVITTDEYTAAIENLKDASDDGTVTLDELGLASSGFATQAGIAASGAATLQAAIDRLHGKDLFINVHTKFGDISKLQGTGPGQVGAGPIVAQHGFHGMTTRPTSFITSEFGQPERVDITPGGGSRGGGQGSNSEMLFLVAQLTDAINSLPRQLRDGLKMGLA